MMNCDEVRAFLYREARAQAERRWQDWLDLYDEQVCYHVPAWDDDDRLTSDPQREVSLIYYPNRQGLEDRVFRIETERSSATVPDTRYNRDISNVEILAHDDAGIEVCFNWTTHSYRYQVVDTWFGTARYRIELRGGRPRITAKTVVIKNDYIHQMLDIYHI